MLSFFSQRYLSEWRTVFWVTFWIFHVTNFFYIVWASAEVQPFNNPENLEKKEEKGEKN